MSELKMLELQQQMRQNQAQLGEYLADLDSWTDDIKKKEEALKEQKKNDDNDMLPPVRNSLEKKRRKKKKKVKPAETEANAKPKARKIKSSDYRSWDKFDVDKALEEIDGEEEKESEESETDEEWEEERKKRQAVIFKDQGNQCFKEGKYDEAVECYTKGISCDPDNAVLPANRAMALIKQEKYGAAELDCTRAVHLDPAYTKAYHRRGTARAALARHADAKEDFLKVLAMDPKNKAAKAELDKVELILNPPEIMKSLAVDANSSAIVKPIHKPPSQRSKKPLRRIDVEEIGIEEHEIKIPKASETKQKLEGKEKAAFDEQFLATSNKIPESQKSPKESEDAATNNLRNKITEITSQVTNGSEDDKDSLKLNLADLDIKKEKKSSSNSSTPQTSPRIPPLPTSSLKFQTDFRALKSRPGDFYQYFKAIPCKKYSTILGSALDDDVLKLILNTLRDHYMPNKEDVFSVLEAITTVKRDFSIVVLFMSADQKKVVRDLLAYAQNEKQASEAKIVALTKKYEV